MIEVIDPTYKVCPHIKSLVVHHKQRLRAFPHSQALVSPVAMLDVLLSHEEHVLFFLDCSQRKDELLFIHSRESCDFKFSII